MEELVANWEISCDGWYPYCTNCNFEPFEYAHEHNGELPEYCPKCSAKMKNCLEFKKEN